MVNLNDLARVITLREAGKQEISIAQVKEVLKITMEELAKEDVRDVLKTIARYDKRR